MQHDPSPSASPSGVEAIRPAVNSLAEALEQLLHSEQRFRLMSETLPDILFTTAPDGLCDYCSDRFYQFTGQPPGSALGLGWLEALHPEDAPPTAEAWRKAIAKGEPHEIEVRYRTGSGAYRWFIVRVNPLRNADGQIIKWVGCSTDIHDLKVAQQAREKSEWELRQVLNAAPVVLWAIDENGIITRSEGKAVAALGRKPEEFVGRSVFEIYKDAPLVTESVRRSLEGEAFTNVITVDDRILESHSFPLRDPEGRRIGATGVAIDISELKRTEQSLRQAQQELEQRMRERTSELKQTVEKLRAEEGALRRLLRLHERERRLLAYDIHDGLTQDVVGAKMMVESIRSQLRPDQQAAQQRLDTVEQLLGTAVGECRRMISNLRPLVIDERGILEAIRYLIGQEESRGGLRVEFKHDVNFHRLAPLLEGSLFRIVQEALSNVRKHSQAHEARIRLTQTDHHLTVVIHDEGIGFDPEAVPEDRYGLEGIRKRAELFGGEAQIDTKPGRGTKVRVTLPLLPFYAADEGENSGKG